MKCPYVKSVERIIPFQPNGELHTIPTKEIEDFVECKGNDCPLYYEVAKHPHCHRVEREKGLHDEADKM